MGKSVEKLRFFFSNGAISTRSVLGFLCVPITTITVRTVIHHKVLSMWLTPSNATRRIYMKGRSEGRAGVRWGRDMYVVRSRSVRLMEIGEVVWDFSGNLQSPVVPRMAWGGVPKRDGSGGRPKLWRAHRSGGGASPGGGPGG